MPLPRAARIIPLIALPALAACASDPTIDRADVRAFDQRVATANDLAATPRSVLPTGAITYEGQLGANIAVDGIPGYGLLGDMRMEVEFDGGRDVTGRVDDINLLRGGRPVELLDGSLRIDGEQRNGLIDADATGVLARVPEFGVVERTNLSLDLDGQVRTDAFNGDTIVGSVDGFGDGFRLGDQDTFNVVVQGEGSFVGTAVD